MNLPAPIQRASPTPRAAGQGALGLLWILLIVEAVSALGVTILLSVVAGDQGSSVGSATGTAEENSTRFAAGGAILFAIAAYVALRGARRRRSWAWTLSAMLQLVLAIAAGLAMFAAGESGAIGAYLGAFALAALTMLVLSTTQVRRALGQA